MVELGPYAQFLTLGLAVYAMAAAIIGARLGRENWVRSAERASYAVFGLLTLAMASLEWAFLTDRFDIAYVAQNSSREQPWIYKLPALWGGQAGSLMLWGWMLAAMVTSPPC